ncbi:alpha/beta fold hydrolase [Streptomyces sp. NPDC093225]|uniref:alpha/beta fold hydrolase n=1 Tax=Streptomyces sp. NPDC093225 TaxID=3366034 RepID=UPI003828A6C0
MDHRTTTTHEGPAHEGPSHAGPAHEGPGHEGPGNGPASAVRGAPAGAAPLPEVPGVTHRWVKVGDVTLHVAEAGAGDPLVLLHGFPQHWYAWRHLVPDLSREHRLICVDLRGFGWSQAPASGYDTDTRVADVLALLDALGLERVGLIGHEWGAWAGFRLCLRAPERISAYLALNMVHPWPLHRRLAPQAWRYWYTSVLEFPGLGRWVLRRRPGFARFLLRKGYVDRRGWDPAAVAEYLRSGAEPARARAGELLHRAYALRDVPALLRGRDKAARLTVPTVILAGAEDFVLPPGVLAGGERYADDLRVEVVPGAGHYLHEERPDVVVAAARALFGQSRSAK